MRKMQVMRMTTMMMLLMMTVMVTMFGLGLLYWPMLDSARHDDAPDDGDDYICMVTDFDELSTGR